MWRASEMSAVAEILPKHKPRFFQCLTFGDKQKYEENKAEVDCLLKLSSAISLLVFPNLAM